MKEIKEKEEGNLENCQFMHFLNFPVLKGKKKKKLIWVLSEINPLYYKNSAKRSVILRVMWYFTWKKIL